MSPIIIIGFRKYIAALGEKMKPPKCSLLVGVQCGSNSKPKRTQWTCSSEKMWE